MVEKREPESDDATRPGDSQVVTRDSCVVRFYRLFFSRIIRKSSITRRVAKPAPFSLCLRERAGVRGLAARRGASGTLVGRASPCPLPEGEGFRLCTSRLSP